MNELIAVLCRIPGCMREHVASSRVPLCHVHHEAFTESMECKRWMAIRGGDHPQLLSTVDEQRCNVAVMDFIWRTDREANAVPSEERKWLADPVLSQKT